MGFGIMKLSEIRKKCKDILINANIDIKDADFIISYVLDKPITNLFIDIEVSKQDEDKICSYINERVKGKPVSKIFNKAYFYGLQFFVDENVLSPRPETELLVDLALNEINVIKKQNKNLKILDLCTGSGAIACAIKSNADVEVLAVDISDKALEVAKRNRKNLNCEIDIVKSNMFKNINGKFDIIVSNPPYIESTVCQNLDVEVKNYDPILALDGGADGLDFYRVIKDNLNYLKPNGVLIMEIGYNQGESLKDLFKEYKVKILKDYNNLDRVVVVKRGEK